MDEIAKLIGSLEFNLNPLEANMKRVDDIVRRMSEAGDRLEGKFKKIDLASSENLATQEKLVNLKYKEAKAVEAIASAKLKEARADKINLQQVSQQVLIQERLARAGQVALRTKQMEAELQNKLADAENKRLAIAIKRLQLEQKMRQIEMGITPGGTGGGGKGGQNYAFGGALEHRMGWFVSSVAFFGSGIVFGNILEQMGNVEAGMIQIQRVTEDATASFSLMKEELFKLGKDFGTNMATVQDIALRWAQAGYNVKDTLELTRTSLLALNTAEMSAETSTQSLIGIMAQWGLQAKDMPLVIDKINKTADDYAITSQDLVDGLLRSSGAARVMGMNFDQLLGILTATREASGRTGREVGNAINSILSYMQRPTAIKTFEGLGIKVFANEARTEFRNVIEIMGELASKWDDSSDQIKDGFVQAADDAGLFSEEMAAALNAQEQWTDLQKRDLSQAAAGTYRRNYLISLLRNFAQAQEVVNNLHDAQGYSLKENERTMTMYQKKVEALNVSLTELADIIGEAGLLDIMKGLADGTRESIDAFTQLPPGVRNAIILFTELSIAVGIANLALRTFTGAGFGYMLIQLAAKIGGVSAATTGLGTALTILASHPIVRLITVLGAAAVALNLYRKSQEQAVQEAMDATIKAQQHAKSVTELTDKYRNLTEDLKNGKDVQEELTSTMQDLAKVFPEVVTQWDEQGNAIAINNDLLRENIRLANEAVRANAVKGLAAAQDKLSMAQGEIDKLQIWDINELSGGLPEKQKIIGEYAGEVRKASADIARFNAILGNSDEGGMIGANLSGGKSRPKKDNNKNNNNNTPGGKPPKPPDFTDPLKEAANKAKLAIDPLNDAIQLTETLLAGVAAREAILDMLIKNQKIPTMEQSRAKYALLNEAMELNKRKQTELHNAAEETRKQLKPLTDQMAALKQQHESGALTVDQFNAATNALRPTINSLEKDIAQYGNQWWEAERAIESAKDAQADMVRTLIRLTREKEKENAIDALAKSQKSALDTLEQQKKKALDDLEEAQKARIRSLESSRDTELKALKDTKDAYEEASNAKIKAIQAEIDALELENDLLNEQEELLSRQKAVEEARTKIANIEADKKIRVVGADGQWTYITDEIALREARKDLESAEKALADTQADIRKNARRRELDAQIKQEQDIQKTQLDSYDKQLEAARKAWDDKLDVERDSQQKEKNQQQQAWDKRLDDFREAQANEKTALENHWAGMLDTERINQDTMNEITQNGLLGPNGALSKWISYYNQLRSLQMQQQMVSTGGSTPTPASSGLNNTTIGSDGLTNYTRAVRDSLLSGGAVVAPAVFAEGGPNLKDQLAYIHANEYILNAKTVRAMGGMHGVERLVATINMPQWRTSQINPAQSPSSITNDRRVQILGDIKLPHVYDASGLIRNLEQYVAAG